MQNDNKYKVMEVEFMLETKSTPVYLLQIC